MADPTPPSDLPDPASPNPEAAKPGATPAGKRIRSLPERQMSSSAANVRSMPDRPGGPKPSAAVRSVPTAEGRTTSAYTSVTLGKERSWTRGIAFVWGLFLVAMALEALTAAFYVMAGKVGWPPLSYLFLSHGPVLPVDLIRLALLCTFFVGLWVGQHWLRYAFALVSLLSSVWVFACVFASYHAAAKFKATGQTDVPVLSQMELLPTIALAILYLVLAAYLFFSIDLREFTVHRRTNGRVWALGLATVVSFGCLAAILIEPQPLYNNWLQKQRASAVAFGEDTLKKMSDEWSPTSIDDRIDPGFATGFTPAARQTTFANFKDLGRLRDAHTAPAPILPPPAPDPLHKVPAATPNAPLAIDHNPDGSVSQMHARYDTTGATFEHGSVRFILDLVRDPSGPWRIGKLDATDVNIERPKRATPPPTAPAASPAPDGTPLSPSPAATASTITTDAAAPTPAATPAAATPAVATPAVPATPAASPAPTTGG